MDHRSSRWQSSFLVLAVALSSALPLFAAAKPVREFNGSYSGANLNRVAFPIGGMGAGMVCLEGTGALSHVSVRHQMEFYNEPTTFAALCVVGQTPQENIARVIEGPIPEWKYFGGRGTGNGGAGTTYGLPRFRNAQFLARFPFGQVSLRDDVVPLAVGITGWSPFTPADPDPSSLPIGALEYRFRNTSDKPQKAVFSFNTRNFMGGKGSIGAIDGGFVLYTGTGDDREQGGAFAIFVDGDQAVVDHCWFRGGWWDALTLAWNNAQKAIVLDNPAQPENSPGASLYVPFSLQPGQEKTIRVLICWYVPTTNFKYGIRAAGPAFRATPAKGSSEGQQAVTGFLGKGLVNTFGLDNAITDDIKRASLLADFEGDDYGDWVADPPAKACCRSPDACANGCEVPIPETYTPWYTTQYDGVMAVANYWRTNYDTLRDRSQLFCDAFYDTTLPPAVVEAAAANLTILKSPTILRQHDGRLWCWEGCCDDHGCCAGSCTHVWNYAQAICHLFPSMERGLRQTEFQESQNAQGRQAFRANLPITPGGGSFDAADGQLGGIMKAYREWRISGDKKWLEAYWPRIKSSLDYMIGKYDPRHTGLLEEDHHNTYDINYFGPDGHCGSFYLGALAAAIKMGQAVGDDVRLYVELLDKGKKRMESELYNGEYFIQIVQKSGLDHNFKPIQASDQSPAYTEVAEIVNRQGPKYQYGTGCLSDGVLGLWMAAVCNINDPIIDSKMVTSHLKAIYKYNLKRDLSMHSNPQRPTFAMGDDGGLLLCSWPNGGKPLLPFVYSDEVWTGIEYQVASHLMLLGCVQEGLDIVEVCRRRYDGVRRNPFNEYECGHWYARAMSSYGLIQGLTGVRYDAVTKTLHVRSSVGDFRSFLSTRAGFGTVELKDGKVSLDVKWGKIPVEKTLVE